MDKVKTVVILYNDGTYTTIKSKVAMAIAYTYIQKWYDLEEFETVVAHDRYNRLYYLMVQKGVNISWILKANTD